MIEAEDIDFGPEAPGVYVPPRAITLSSNSDAAHVDQPGHTWTARDLVELSAKTPEPPSIGGLLYPGRRRFAYLEPEEAATPLAVDHVRGLLAQRHGRLVVFDAFNSALMLHGLDPSSTVEVERFWRIVVHPFSSAGVAVALPDHVVKQRDARGKYAYGSERKHSGAEVHLGMVAVEPFGRGRTGRAKLTVHKDRPGFFERPSPGLFVLVSDPDDGRCRWEVEPDSSITDGGDFRPTHLMERVSRYLEIYDEARPRRAIEDNVKGKAEYLRQAIDALIGEGHAVEFDGPRGARLVKLETPYWEHE
jgi:hypothetical protein